MKFLTTLVLVYFTQLETQTELVVQAAGYEQPTGHCALLWCSWVARSKTTGNWEQGRVLCSPMLDCKVTHSEPATPP